MKKTFIYMLIAILILLNLYFLYILKILVINIYAMVIGT